MTADDRRDRLAAALRANLRRRKRPAEPDAQDAATGSARGVDPGDGAPS
ncbi:MAG: hypothetical protein ACRYFW_12325 [Janthinobacterium lividum]